MINQQPLKEQEDFNLKEQIFQYLRYWPWFVTTVLITLFLSYMFIRYSTYIYQSEATILIKDEDNSSLSELAAFQDLGFGGSGLSKSEFENEIEIIKSKRIISKVVNDLNLNVRYFVDGNIKSSEVYMNTPLIVEAQFLQTSEDLVNTELLFKKTSPTSFEITNLSDESVSTGSIGKPIIFEFGSIVVNPNIRIEDKESDWEALRVVLRDVETTVNEIRSNLNVQSVSKNGSIIKLSYNSSASDKSESIINALINAYNEDAIEDRNLVSANTAAFIDNRLDIITTELDSVETRNVDFREDNRITDIMTEGQIYLQSATQLQKEQMALTTKIGLVASMEDYLDNEDTNGLLPTNLGIADDGMASAIENYNELILQKERLLKSSTEANPAVVLIKEQIEQLKGNILESLRTVATSLEIENRDLIKERGSIGGRIARIPSISKSARDILRQQEIKEALYLYLLQKREETAISLAVTTPKAKIVDWAYTERMPISPKPKIIYLAAFILGLLIPFGFIYLKNLFDTKIHNRLEVEREVPGLPILGEIPTVDHKDSETIKSNDRSVLAEAFRILRTNLSYFIKSKGKDSENIIFVTSTIKGEGKTFVAYNLGLSLMSTGKSVLLVGADIRNPQLHRYIDKNEWTIGLSEYLFDSDVSMNEIINSVNSGDQQFDLILSGRIPPNPAELLMNQRFEKLIESVKVKYDYVIVDTAPTLLVTDTLLISQIADMTVYVCRGEYTDKKLLQYPKELITDGKLKNVAFAINGIKTTNFGYGSKYGYGYGYGQEKDSLIQRIKSYIKLG